MRRIRRVTLGWLLVLVIVISSGGALSARAQNPLYAPALLPAYQPEMNAHPNAPRYSIDLTLDLTEDAARVTGQQTVLYTNQTGIPLTEIVFRLYPNLNSYGGDMIVSAVTVGGESVEPVLDATRSILAVPLRTQLAPGAQTVIAMQFLIMITANRAQLYGQFSYQDGVLSLPNAYPMLAVYEPGTGWWTITDHPQGDIVFSETAFFDVRVTAPADLILAACGTVANLVANGNGTLTHTFVAPLMRDFALFGSRNFVGISGEQDGVRIMVYYDPATPQGAAAAQQALQITRDALRIFNAAFGPYPFVELDVVQTPNTAGGMEYPGLFVMSANIWNTTDPTFAFLVVHETAHQWFYSLVGNDQALHPWVDEALVQYATALYIRGMEGDAAYRAALDAFRAQHAAFIDDHPDQQIGAPVSAYPGLAYFFTVYQKGPLFFAALDEQFGTDAVIAALRDYSVVYRYRIATPDALRASLEASLGADLGALFAEWITDQEPVG